MLPRPLSHTHFLRNGACAGMPGCPDNPFRKKLKVYFLGGDQIARFLIDFCMFEGFFRANCPIWSIFGCSNELFQENHSIFGPDGTKKPSHLVHLKKTLCFLAHLKKTLCFLVQMNQKNPLFFSSNEPKKPLFTWIFSKNSHHFRRKNMVQMNHYSKKHRYYRVILNHQKWVTMDHLVHLNRKTVYIGFTLAWGVGQTTRHSSASAVTQVMGKGSRAGFNCFLHFSSPIHLYTSHTTCIKKRF